jgi:hypothetical protein
LNESELGENEENKLSSIDNDNMELDDEIDNTNTIIEVNNLNDLSSASNLNNNESNQSIEKLTEDEILVRKARMQLDVLKMMEEQQKQLIAKQKAAEIELKLNQTKSQDAN